MNHSYENSFLMLSCELKYGEIFPVPFEQLRYDCTYEASKHIKDKMVDFSRRYFHQIWASKLLQQRRKSLIRMIRVCRIKKDFRILIRKPKELERVINQNQEILEHNLKPWEKILELKFRIPPKTPYCHIRQMVIKNGLMLCRSNWWPSKS